MPKISFLTMLDIRSFSKSYDGELILSVEGLTLSPGAHMLKGDNGSGKTTFFKCVAGIVPAAGEISIGGLSLNSDPIGYRYCVNFAEAEPRYPSFLTGKDLIQFVARTRKAPPDQVTYYCQRLGVNWFKEKSCGTYSSGMLKKLSLTLAFLGNPKLIIFDEPLITLDQTTRNQFYSLMMEKKETIFLLSSHEDMEQSLGEMSAIYRIRKKTIVIE